MTVAGEYLGMQLVFDELDRENREFFEHCADHELHLQRCSQCGLLRYPPTTACPFCSALEAVWSPVAGRGSVYSYYQVEHAIQPAFRQHLPYLVLLVELDEQRGRPTEHDALRMTGNLVTPEGHLAPPELVAKAGIGSRVRLVFRDVAARIALPQWTLDEAAPQPVPPWRYPGRSSA